MAHHNLEIEKHFMDAKILGNKPFEIRFNDRGYQKGDTIAYTSIEGWPKLTSEYIDHIYEITYVTSFEQKYNWVVFGDKIRKKK